ncbi:MAG: S1 family peptidase [Sandaracinaceae bacterium]|nr:S1 family peptidase [Sandaracinaceae bacterium]MDW8245881.1 S1 family peptidase [Sandaracinaceae bacterium]
MGGKCGQSISSKFRWLSFATLLLLLGACEGNLGVPQDGRSSSRSFSPLVGGQFTYERPHVGLFEIHYPNGTYTFCTATLISPRVIITAAHCFDYESRDNLLEDPRLFLFKIQISETESYTYRIIAMRTFVTVSDDPDYTFPVVGPWDVGVMLLEESVPPHIAQPARLAHEYPEDGEWLSIYGYGCQNREGWGRDRTGSGRKQVIRTRWPVRIHQGCPGDSGGPTLTSDEQVVQVNSGGCERNNCFDIFGDVVRYRREIEGTIAEWTGELPSPPSPPEPEPGTEPEPSNHCASLDSCESAVSTPFCAWCEGLGHGVRINREGEALDFCPSGFRTECSTTHEDRCGEWAGLTEFTCQSDGVTFVRCLPGGEPEFAYCPHPYSCTPGSTEWACY